MAASNFEPLEAAKSGLAQQAGRATWQGIRISLLMILKLVEPVARFSLTAIALLGILVSFFLEFSGAAPRFPFWMMLGLSLGCGAVVFALNAVIRWLAR